jgi:hypothetical protein
MNALVLELANSQVTGMLLELLDGQVSQVEFVFQALKNREDDAEAQDDESSSSEAAPLRDKVYLRLAAVAECFSELAASSLRGPPQQNILRSWIKFCKLLHIVVTDVRVVDLMLLHFSSPLRVLVATAHHAKDQAERLLHQVTGACWQQSHLQYLHIPPVQRVAAGG